MITALACLICSGFYLDASLVIADSGVEQYATVRNQSVFASKGVIESTWSESSAFSNRADNPYGRITLGYEYALTPRLRVSSEFFHESSLATRRDRGVNGGRVSLRWFPFGGR